MTYQALPGTQMSPTDALPCQDDVDTSLVLQTSGTPHLFSHFLPPHHPTPYGT